MSSIFKPEDYLQWSQQLYCVITDHKGRILHLNDLAKRNLALEENLFIHDGQWFISQFLDGNKNGDQIQILHQLPATSFQLTWEVVPLVQKKIRYYKWLTPALYLKSPLASETETQYKQYIDQNLEGIFRIEFTTSIHTDRPTEDLVSAILSQGYIGEINETMARMYGYNFSHEIIGGSFLKLLKNDSQHVQLLSEFVKNDFKLNDVEVYEENGPDQHRYFLKSLVGFIEDGVLKMIWGTQKDITAKRDVDEKLRTLASLVEQTSDVLTMADLDFKPLIWNKAAERVYGLKAEQVIGKNLRDFIDISYQNADREDIRQAILGEGEWRGEMHFTRPTDGVNVTLWISFKGLTNDKGALIGYIIGGSDISDLKVAEKKLIESENRFKYLASSAPVMIWMSDAAYDIVYLNACFADFIGKNIQRLHRQTWRSFIHPDDEKLLFKNLNESLSAKKPVKVVYRMLNKTGSYHWVLDTVSPRFLEDGVFVGFIGCIVDINEQKAVEEQLRYQVTLLENVSDIIVIADLDFCIQSVNKVAEEFYGLGNKKYKGQPFAEMITLNYSSDQKKRLAEFYNTGLWKGEVSYVNERGEIKYLLNTLSYVNDNNGEKIGIMMVGRDITDRKLAEEKLRKSEEFYRTLISDSVNGMILVDEAGIISFAASSIKNVLGYNPEEVSGKSAFDFIHEEDKILTYELFKAGLVDPKVEFVSIRLIKKNGQLLWCMARGHNLLNHPLIGKVVIHFHDDTLRKKANDALEESEQRFRTLIANLQVGVLLINKTGNIVIANKAMSDMMQSNKMNGFDLKSAHHKVINENEEEITLAQWPASKAMLSKKPIRDEVLGVYIQRSNDYVWLIMNADPILDEEGEILHILCTCVDITERKKLEKKLVEEKINHQKLLTQATIDGQEAERKEIGKELHDNIGQQLTSIKLYLDMATSSVDDSTRDMVHLAAKNVLQVINEVRSISRSLVPPTLGDLGLVDSIQELIDSINRTQGLHISFNHEGFNEFGIAENKKLTIFRIAQEQLANIVKHANASKVQIDLEVIRSAVQLTIKDDGNGFDLKKIRKGLGLTNIKNRAELFGGYMQINTGIGLGCTLVISIPHSLHSVAN